MIPWEQLDERERAVWSATVAAAFMRRLHFENTDSDALESATKGEETMKPLLVAECNPYGGPPSNALIPDPPYCAGWNLCHKILRLSESDYYERFDRVNLCHRKWSVIEARKKAVEVSSDERTFVLFGAKVTRVFAWMLGHEDNFNPFTWHEESHRVGPLETPTHVVRRYVVLPHPSGLSRAWHEPGAFERARAVLREAGVL